MIVSFQLFIDSQYWIWLIINQGDESFHSVHNIHVKGTQNCFFFFFFYIYWQNIISDMWVHKISETLRLLFKYYLYGWFFTHYPLV